MEREEKQVILNYYAFYALPSPIITYPQTYPHNTQYTYINTMLYYAKTYQLTML